MNVPELTHSALNIHTEDLLRYSPMGIAVFIGERLMVKSANPSYLSIIRKPDLEFTGRPFAEAMPELEEQGLGKIMTGVLKTGTPFSTTESELVFTNNGLKQAGYFNMLFQPLQEGGTVTGVMAMISEVTDYVAVRRRLLEEEQRSRLAIEAADIGTFDLDMITHDFVYSPKLAHIFGYPDSKGLSHAHFSSVIHAEDIASRSQAHRQAAEEGRLRYEARVVWPDQSIHWVRVHGMVVYNHGVPGKLYGTALDITKEKADMKLLEEGEMRMRLMTDSAEFGTFDVDLLSSEGIYSQKYLQIMGHDQPVDWTRDHFLARVHADDRAIVENGRQAAFISGKLHYEVRILWPDHTIRWIRKNAKIFYNSSGEPVRMLGTVIDITDQKNTLLEVEELVAARTLELTKRNRELQQQKEFVDKILDASIDVIAVFDKEERFLSVNKKHEDAYGRKKEEMLGKKMADVFPQAANLRMHLGLQKALKGEYVHEAAYRSPVTNRYVELFCIPLKDNGEVYAAIVVAHDITEIIKSSEQLRSINAELEKKNSQLAFSEERYHKMIGEVKDYAIIFIDRQGFIQNWNKGAQNIKGYSEQEIIGKNFRIFYTKPDLENKVPDKLMEEAITKGRAITEGWRLRKDGSAFWGNMVLTALYNEQEEVIGFSKVTRDLTERKVSEDKLKLYTEELRQKNAELERSNQELISFSYVASHDLQEPLRKINTFSEQILEKEAARLSDSGKNYFTRMQTSILRMQSLIQDLLEYSRINTIDKKFERTDLNAILNEVRNEFHERLEEKKGLLTSADLPVLDIIPFQLKQVFSNLIGNALKFSKENVPPRIVVSYAPESVVDDNDPASSPEMYHRISVADNGIGFEEQYRERIFQIFQRLHGKNEYAGTGIGLAICQRVAQNHRGFLRATGEVGEGATFHLYLPVSI